MTHQEKIEVLQRQGVNIPCPETLEIGDEVDLARIKGPGTTLHGGTKLYGEALSIQPGCTIGYEEPVTLEGCALGRDVQLRGGYFAGSVFLDRVVVGKGAHIRGGTLMEEESNGAHTVGLKQTLLLPFVTLGSLINFCDILMAGGTSRKDHSEVGSSFIHFNFTPFGASGDKATPSLVGDVPRGVMLRSPRIFLGGQAGLVGPIHIDFGTVLAAGFVYRRDHGPDELVVGEKLPPRTLPFFPNRYSRIRAKVDKNLTYIGNLVALWHWYEQVRLPLCADVERRQLFTRAQGMVELCLAERIKRLGQIAGYMEASIRELAQDGAQSEVASQRLFAESWPQMEGRLKGYRELAPSTPEELEAFGAGLNVKDNRGKDYLEVIRGLSDETQVAGTRWLTGIVETVRRFAPRPPES